MKTILIVLMGSLGDVVRGMCVLPALKKRYPEIKITWLVEPKCEAIVRLNPLIDKVTVFQRGKGITAIFELYKELSGQEFDCVFDMQRHFKSGIFSSFPKSKRKIGFHRKNSKELNWLFNREKIKFVPDNVSKIENYLGFLEILDLPYQEPLDFGFSSDNFECYLPKELKGKRYIGVVLGSSWESKDWLLPGYQELIKILNERGERVVLLGDKTQIEKAAALEDLAFMNLAAKTSIAELCAVIKNAKICVGPDSGPAHIAAAVGVPYVGLFGPTLPERVAAYGNLENSIRSSVGCSPCLRRECPGLGKICMKLISPEVVAERIFSVL